MLIGKLWSKKQNSESQLGFMNGQERPLLFQVIRADDLPQVKALVRGCRDTAN